LYEKLVVTIRQKTTARIGIIFPIRALFTVLIIYGVGMIVYGATGKLSLDEMLKNKIRSKDE
jgi:hypothetical protein